MGIITKPYNEVDGTIIEASSINGLFDPIYNLQNQALSSNNFANSGITAPKLSDQSVTGRTFDADAILAQQVFGG